MLFDLPREALETYVSNLRNPDDFDEFWADTLADARGFDLAVEFEEVDTPLSTMKVYDLRFRGYGGQPVHAWVRVPRDTTGATVVQYFGYGRGRGEPIEDLLWASAGFVHVAVDTRGQGWSFGRGDTTDPAELHGGPPGFVTLGIRSRESYYYRRVFTDAVRAIEAARELPAVDPGRVGIYGTSQGGAIALAATALAPDVRALVTRMPFLSDVSRAIRITDANPYAELTRFFSNYRDLADHIESEVLPYFDGINFARRATAPALIVAALMDGVCPPSTVYGVHNEYAGPSQLVIRPFNGHEGGGVDDDVLALEHLRTELGR